MKKTKSKNQKAKGSVKPVSTPVPVAPRTFRDSLKDALTWVDNNILLVLTGFLAVFIPAYPKLPLADLIEGYIVRLRLDDLVVLVSMLIWFIQILRKKVRFPTNLVSKFIVAYLAIGLLSTLSAMFITHTVPLQWQHVFKLYLHYARRIEYMSVFFLAYSAVKTKKDLYVLMTAAGAALVGVVAYGLGQKYLLWPAFSTMNREFSKGMRLYLSPQSRVMSTFAGHYDYAAYLMIALTVLVSAFWSVKNWIWKVGLIILFAAAYWSLILTASRTSFLGYVGGVTIIAFIVAPFYGRLRTFANWFMLMAVSMTVMLTMGDLSDRFFQVLNNPDLIIHDITQMTPIKREWIEKPLFFLHRQQNNLAMLKSSMNTPVATPPPNSTSSEENVAAKSDTPPSAEKPLPPDVTAEEDANRKAQEAARNATASAGGGYSPNALRYGLSVAIRLDALWPRAVEGFDRNPLLGSGYSTLTKATNDEFTIAESTDNDYLRMLGETGLAGTLTFLAIPLLFAYASLKLFRQVKNPLWYRILGLGIIGGVVGLLINASYIDVFESSKIAYMLFILGALVIRASEMAQVKKSV